MYYIDQLKNKANMAIRSRTGKVVLSLDEVTGVMGEIEELKQKLDNSPQSSTPVEQGTEAEDTIYVDVSGGSFKS